MKALVFAALLAAAPALAQSQEPRILSMSGHGEDRAVPDQVEITAGVTTSAATAAAALAANTARMKTVFAALSRLGVAERNIQTANFSVSPQYTNGANNEAPRLTGYQVSNSVSVRLDDTGKLGAALDALVTAGANQMNGIGFSIKEPSPLLKTAREQAVADARERAETYARAAGVTLGPILAISESGNDAPRPMPKVMYMARAASAVPVAAGEESVGADVSITWEIH
jgi:uncharacterized protein YggE